MSRRRNPRRSDRTAMEILRAPAKAASGSEWSKRHDKAFNDPKDIEKGIVYLLVAWATYADEHYERFGSSIGEDGFLGKEWENIADSLFDMLNGELGRLDGGTLDGKIRAILENEDLEGDAR
jgi:hypothetical protein